MNGANIATHILAERKRREERYRALVDCEQRLNQILYHLRALRIHNDHHGLLLDLPTESQIVDAMGQCARIHQLDKENTR